MPIDSTIDERLMPPAPAAEPGLRQRLTETLGTVVVAREELGRLVADNQRRDELLTDAARRLTALEERMAGAEARLGVLAALPEALQSLDHKSDRRIDDAFARLGKLHDEFAGQLRDLRARVDACCPEGTPRGGGKAAR